MPSRLSPHDVAAALGIPEATLGDPTHGVGWSRLLDYIASHEDAAEAARTAHALDPRWICDGKLHVHKIPGFMWVVECSCGKPLAQALQYRTALGFTADILQRRSYRWREERRCGRCGGSTSGPTRCVHSWAKLFTPEPTTDRRTS